MHSSLYHPHGSDDVSGQCLERKEPPPYRRKCLPSTFPYPTRDHRPGGAYRRKRRGGTFCGRPLRLRGSVHLGHKVLSGSYPRFTATNQPPKERSPSSTETRPMIPRLSAWSRPEAVARSTRIHRSAWVPAHEGHTASWNVWRCPRTDQPWPRRRSSVSGPPNGGLREQRACLSFIMRQMPLTRSAGGGAGASVKHRGRRPIRTPLPCFTAGPNRWVYERSMRRQTKG